MPLPQDIDLGTGANNNDGDFVYTGFQKTKQNLEYLDTRLDAIGFSQFDERAIDLNGSSGTEFQRVANAINNLIGITIPLGKAAVFSYLRPYSPGGASGYFIKDAYLIKQGSGFYGTGTPPAGIPQITVDDTDIFKFATSTTEIVALTSLGEIGTTPIQTAVGASTTEIVKKGITILNITRSGVPEQYIFDDEDGSYGVSWNSTSASKFSLASIVDYRNTVVNDAIKAAETVSADIAITASNLYVTNRLSQANATVTINTNAVTPLEIGSIFRLSFGGTGAHTVNYPITDGLSALACVQGDFVYCEKIDTDSWIVKKY